MIQTIVERIYIVDKDDERFCHIFIKGCTDEDYTGFFQTAGYIEQKTAPVCDLEQHCICAKVSPPGNIWKDKRRYRTNTSSAVCNEESGDNRRRSLPGSYPYAGINTTPFECVAVCRVFERKELFDDI